MLGGSGTVVQDDRREPRRMHIITYGCQMNEHDAEVIAGFLKGMGYADTGRPEEADLIMVVTCCVRRTAEDRAYGRIGELKRFKDARPGLIIGVCGCMVQREGVAAELSSRAPHVDLVFGTHNLHRLPELLGRVEAGERPVVEIWEAPEEVADSLPRSRFDDIRSWVIIMYGCDNFCSYCIVPYVRGRQRSRQPEHVLAEVESVARAGYKEVTLLGQNVNAYGTDLGRGVDFADLLRAVDGVSGLERIRYLTSHPRDFTQKMIDTVAAGRRICEHFHLPLQAGSDRVLALMNRGYTTTYYVNLVERIRSALPGASITTDLIVGFPGESELDFAQTLDVVRTVEFDAAFTFLYSPRPGTRAAEMPGQVPLAARRERLARLIEEQNGIGERKNALLVGRTVEVLVEGRSERNPSRLVGRTRTNKVVIFAADPALRGSLVPVRVRRAHAWTLYGESAGT